jgi:hypothetical protein
MEFVRRTAGYTSLDYRKDLGILKELNIKLVMEFVEVMDLAGPLKRPLPNSPSPSKREQ